MKHKSISFEIKTHDYPTTHENSPLAIGYDNYVHTIIVRKIILYSEVLAV